LASILRDDCPKLITLFMFANYACRIKNRILNGVNMKIQKKKTYQKIYILTDKDCDP